MEYFFYGRDRPGVAELRRETMEKHWAFMDGYADALIARGPTLTDDESGMTGSVHMVQLPDRDAVQSFGYDEPFYKAGVFGELLVCRFSNTLGQTMWEFSGAGGQRFLAVAHGNPEAATTTRELGQAQDDYFTDPGLRDRVIVCGPLCTEDGSQWLGTALLAEVADRDAVEALLTESPYGRAGLYREIEIHRWRFGGRPSPQRPESER